MATEPESTRITPSAQVVRICSFLDRSHHHDEAPTLVTLAASETTATARMVELTTRNQESPLIMDMHRVLPFDAPLFNFGDNENFTVVMQIARALDQKLGLVTKAFNDALGLTVFSARNYGFSNSEKVLPFIDFEWINNRLNYTLQIFPSSAYDDAVKTEQTGLAYIGTLTAKLLESELNLLDTETAGSPSLLMYIERVSDIARANGFSPNDLALVLIEETRQALSTLLREDWSETEHWANSIINNFEEESETRAPLANLTLAALALSCTQSEQILHQEHPTPVEWTPTVLPVRV